jgi:plastocyanin
MNLTSRRASGLVGIVAGVTLLVTGCSSGGEEPVATAATEGTVVTVTEKEFSISLSQTEFTPGVYTFVVNDEGETGHNFNIEGPGVTGVATADISAGGTDSVTVTLESGTYELWCSIGAHRASGMEMTVTVG